MTDKDRRDYNFCPEGILTGKNEKVNHPTHYNSGKIEVIDFIEDQKLGFSLGNCIKYICRAGKKTSNPIEDLNKAKWYLEREIQRLQKNDTSSSK